MPDTPRRGLTVVGSTTARIAELRAKRSTLAEERDQLSDRHQDHGTDALGNMTGVEERIQRLDKGIDRVQAEIDELVGEQRSALAAGVASGQFRTERGDDNNDATPFNVSFRGDPWAATDAETAEQTRSRSLTAIERWNADDKLKASATTTVERAGRDAAEEGDRDVAGVAAHVIRYSEPAYCSAFRKFTRDPQLYIADLTPAEAQAWRSAREYQTRAALGTSGAVLPSPLDPAIVLTNDGAVDPMRSVARVDTTISKSKRYITSAGSTFSYDAELAEVSDDSFSEAEVEIDTHKGQGFIQASLEVWADQPDFSNEVAKIIADGKARVDANIFINGTGTNQPFGIEVSLNATASEINAAGEALVADDVYGLLEALPPRFRRNAVWQLELSTINFIARLFNPTGTEPPLIEGDMLIRRPFVENSSIDPYSGVDAGATASNRVLFVGDWQHYVILDRVGTQVYFVPPGVLQNTANNLPDGRVGWYAVWRTGAEVLTTSAFRMLDVATAA